MRSLSPKPWSFAFYDPTRSIVGVVSEDMIDRAQQASRRRQLAVGVFRVHVSASSWCHSSLLGMGLGLADFCSCVWMVVMLVEKVSEM